MCSWTHGKAGLLHGKSACKADNLRNFTLPLNACLGKACCTVGHCERVCSRTSSLMHAKAGPLHRYPESKGMPFAGPSISPLDWTSVTLQAQRTTSSAAKNAMQQASFGLSAREGLGLSGRIHATYVELVIETQCDEHTVAASLFIDTISSLHLPWPSSTI